MKIRKILALIIVIVLLSTVMLSFTACNNGLEKDIPGIYTIKQMFYKDLTGEIYSYADQYDYFLIVLYKDKTAKIMLRPYGGEEMEYNTTYSLVFEEDSDVVSYINISEMPLITVKEDVPGSPVFTEGISETEFTNRNTFSNIVKEQVVTKFVNGHFKFGKMKYKFHRVYKRTTDRKIRRAIKGQISTRENRAKDVSDD